MRRTIRRLLAVILALVLVGLAYGGWRAYGIYQDISTITGRTVDRTPYEPKIAIPPLNGNQRVNILVLGSDNDLKPEEKRPLTQSMIVVSLDPRHDKVSMLSIPRDFWVPIRGHGYAKIDLANKYGGLALARETVEKLFHIPIDYYAWVGLNGFTNVINTFGGINLNILHPVLDDYYPNDLQPGNPYAYTRIFIPPGWRHMSGEQALQYVRSRHGDIIGDFGRSQRQQQILLQLRDKLDTLSIILHLPSLADALKPSVRTDLSVGQLRQLQAFSRNVKLSDITRLVLSAPTYCTDGQPSAQNGYQDVLYPNWKVIRPAVKKLFPPINTTPAKPGSHRTTVIVPKPTTKPAKPTGPRAAASTPTPETLNQLPANAFFVRDGGIYELTRNRALIQLVPWGGVAMPSISPDGKLLTYMVFKNYASDLYTFNLKTHAWSLITHDATTDLHNNIWAAWPIFTRDGSQILYASDRQKLQSAESEGRQVDLAIWEQPVAGGDPVQLTQPALGAGGDTDPVPLAGNSFLYEHWYYGANSQPYAQIMLRNPSGTTTAITPDGQRSIQPTVDQAGTMIAYVQSGENSSRLVVGRLGGTSSTPAVGKLRVLFDGEVAQPAFTPDGRWVSFLKADGDSFDLYLVPVTGGTPIKVDTGAALDATSRPVWSK